RAIAFAIVAGGRDVPGARLPGGTPGVTPGVPVGGLPVGFPVLNARFGSPGIPGTCRAAGTELNLISCLGVPTIGETGVFGKSESRDDVPGATGDSDTADAGGGAPFPVGVGFGTRSPMGLPARIFFSAATTSAALCG